MTDAPTGKMSPQALVVQLLTDRLEDAKLGKINAVMIGYTTPEGGAAVECSPIGPIMLNHLSTLLERRVSRAYDRAAQAAAAPPNPGVGKVPATGKSDKVVPKAQMDAPRNTRRAIARAVKKAATKNAQKSPGNGAAIAAKPS